MFSFEEMQQALANVEGSFISAKTEKGFSNSRFDGSKSV